MKTAVKTSVVAGAIALAATFGAPSASATQTTTNWLGTQADVVDGGVVQGWVVSHLQPSTDVIPYPLQGQLWEATASDTSIQGNAIPIIGNFNARAADGTTYRVLWEVATPQGVNPATLTQGASTSGKIYFDVTGPAPDSVVYRGADGPDVALWLTPPTPPAGSSSSTYISTGTQGQVPAAAATATTDGPEAVPAAPEGESVGVPLSEVGEAGAAESAQALGVPGVTPPEATPAPLAVSGVPAPAAVPGVPAPASAGVPAPAAVPGAPAPAAVPGAPAVAPPAAAEAAPPAAPGEEVIVVEVVPETPPAPATQ